ncbi:MAG: response regulator [Clostridiales bacterium]|jgi:PleD family two-component response regulator|nr:response regulator [Clostridiales bacterium]
MENTEKEFFDLYSMLKYDFLNIRKISADKPYLLVKDYFGLLSKFIKVAPGVKRALKNMILRESDINDYKELHNISVILEALNSQNLIADLYALLDAYDRGNLRLASFHAERFDKGYDKALRKINLAKRLKKPEHLSDEGMALKSYIKILDDEEDNRKLFVLVVDDSPIILKSVSAVLSGEYKVFTLPKPTMIEKILNQLTPDLFLLDYLMPGLNGFDLIPIIRKFEEHKNTPIIFLTSEGTVDNVTAALALGASDFIVKPFNPDKLREKIAKHITRKKLL